MTKETIKAIEVILAKSELVELTIWNFRIVGSFCLYRGGDQLVANGLIT